MTLKKEAIALAALKLFSNEGYSTTSTKKIADFSGVSEALIFRHFGSKKGLLNFLLFKIEERFCDSIRTIKEEKEPKKIISKILNEAFTSMQIDSIYWNLNYQLKRELKSDLFWKMDLIYILLLNAFRKLNVESPEKEAKFLVLFLQGMGSNLYDKSAISDIEMLDFLSKKYELT